MKINVKYLTKVQKVLGKKKEEFEIQEETNIRTFIEKYLLKEHTELKDLFFSNGSFNQENIDGSAKLGEGDNLTFMVAISGG